MAKRGNNSLGRRSYGGKPYDANNSFVKKMANKVGDLMPQRSWISKWFNTSEDNADEDNEMGEEGDAEEEVQPPVNKRPRIRMDVTHPPGTFSIQPSGRESSGDNRLTNDRFAHTDETGEDLPDPPVAGPSGVRSFVASTPAISADPRNSNSQRSELNSLISSQNYITKNRASNGVDDNSESSESTSGCSSLIPQTNRQESSTNLPYNSNSASRKREIIDEKLSFTNHLQSPRCLFLDSGSRESLSSRRPSFNASMMSNAIDRTSSLSSPFYTGNVTFGGANALSHYKPSRSLFNSTNEFQLKIPRRTSVNVKPSNNECVDSSGMSQTAKRILEAMEYFSSPISDAKKIPLKNSSITTSGRKRMRDENVNTPNSRVGLRHLTRELSVPTVPDMLKLRRRQKLQDTTVAARKIVSAMSGPPTSSSARSTAVQPSDEYHLPTAHDENPKFHGKLRAKSKEDPSAKEPPRPVNLPNITLPITWLPNFEPLPKYAKTPRDETPQYGFPGTRETQSFDGPVKTAPWLGKSANPSLPTISMPSFEPFSKHANASPDENSESRCSGTRETFKFASPIKMHEAAWNLKSINNFSFSKPLNADDSNDVGREFGRSAKTISDDSNFSTSVTFDGPTINFKCPASSTAPRLKVKTKSNEKNSEANAEKTFELKTGSVMDVLGPKTGNVAKIDGSPQRSNSSPNFGDKPSTEIWECNDCYIKNDGGEKICVACKASKPNGTGNKTSSVNFAASSNSGAAEFRSGCYVDELKTRSGHWKCIWCRVENPLTDFTCVSCSTPRPGEKSAAPRFNVPSSFADAFKPAEGSWECPGCMLRNPGAVITCPCCKAAKPTSLNKFKPTADSWECSSCMVRNNETSTTCVCCSTPKPGSSTKTVVAAKSADQPLATSGWGDKFKKPQGSWSCDSCMIQNKSDVTECAACGTLKPGATAKPVSSNFSFGVPSTGQNFTFGVDKANAKPKDAEQTASNGFTFGAKPAESENDAAVKTFTFGMPKSKESPVKSMDSVGKSGGFVFAPPKNADDVGGFKFETSDEKSVKPDTTANDEKKAAATFSFGMPKTMADKTNGSGTKTIFGGPALEPNGKPHFVFGAPKSDGNATETVKPAPKLSFGVASTDSSVQKSSAFPSETSHPNSVGKQPEKTDVSSAKSVIAVTEQPTSTTPSFINPNASPASSASTIATQNRGSFGFSDSKPKEPSTVSCFGRVTSETPSASSTFAMTAPKPGDVAGAASPFGACPTAGVSSSLSDKSTDAKSPTPSVFGTIEKKPSFFEITSTEKTPSAFGAPEKKTPMFGGPDNKLTGNFVTPDKPVNSPMFNSPSPAFGAPAAAASQPIFGNNSTSSVFGAASLPNFGTTVSTAEAPSIFAAAKPTAAPSTASPGMFTFGGGASQPATATSAAPAPFSFTGNPTTANTPAKSLFTFGGNAAPGTAAAQPGEGFASAGTISAGGFGSPATARFSYNAPQDHPNFGQATGTVPNMFGAQPTAPSVGQAQPTQLASTGFNFGAAAPAPAAGVFSFGGGMSQPASAPSSGFNFNAPSASPGIAFDPNTRPTFNFTGGSAPTAFNATPQPATARKIKKAVRRMPQR